MVHRINIVLDDIAWLALKEVPKGERSRLIGQAIKKMAEAQQRLQSAKTMDALRRKLPTLSTENIVEQIRKDRQRKK